VNRALRFAAYVLAGVVIGLVVAYGAIQLLSRTDWGRERVRGFALGWLDDKIAGDVRIGRLGGGGLLSGVVIHDFAIVDSLGRTFVQADSAEVSYAWRTLLGGDIVLDEATLYHPVVNLEMLPGDTLWNFERLFPDTTPGTSTPSRNLIMFDEVRIVDGEVAIRRPWEPDDPPTVEDTARILLEDVESGRVTVMRFEIDDALFDRFIWESPLEEGKMLEVDRLRGSGYVWREPIVIEDLQGTLTWVDSIVSFEVPRVELPATRAAAVGQVVIGEDENRYDVRIDGQQLAFEDLQWLYPELPAEGAGSLILRIQSQQPKGILFLAERARITMPGTQLAGTLGIVAGDTLYFTTVDLQASPLDLDLLERLLPGGLPVEGLLIGTVEISGPLSSLQTRGDVRLEQPGSDAPNAVRWAGTIDVRGERARGLRADFEGFDLAVLQDIRPSSALHGRVTGTIEATGDLARGIDLVASLEHSEGAVAPTRVVGGGTVRVADGRPEFDVDITSGAFSLESLGAWAPALADLRGEAEGPIQVTGSPDDVRVAAQLRTAAGGLTFDGRVDRRGPVPRFSGQGTATAFQLRALSDSLPDARMTGHLAFDVAGRGIEDMTGSVRIDIDTADVAGVGIERARFAGTLADGIVAVDTLTAASAGVRLSANGDFGIVAGRSGTLRVDAAADRLETLEPLLFEEVADPLQPRVGGRLTASATLAGGVSAFDLSASALLEDWHWNDESGARAALDVTGVALATDAARLGARLAADSLRVLDRTVDSARIAADYAGGSATVTAIAHHAGAALVRVAGAGRRAADGTYVELADLALGSGDSAWVLRDTASVRFGTVGADVEGFALGRVDGTGLVTAGGRLAWVRDAALRTPASLRPVDFRAELRQVPFHEFLRLLNSDADGHGLVDGTITVAGSARAPKLHADVSVADLTWDAVGVERLTAGFAYDSSLITARFEAFQQDRRVLFGEGHIPADLRFAPAGQRRLAETLQFGLQADSMPAALVFGFLDGFYDVRGVIDGAIEATGTTREPALDGALLLRGGATWAATGVRYDDIIGTVQFIGDRIARVDVRAVAQDPREDEPTGSAWLTGRLDLERFSDPGFDLTLQARRMLAARRRDMDLTATGDVHITGSYTGPRISGSIRVDGGTLYLDELYRQYLIVGLDDPSLIQAVDTSLVADQRLLPAPESPFLRNLVVTDATIVVGPGSWLRSREMNVEVAGELTVSLDRTNDDITLSGTLTAVRGTYRLDYPGFARIFEVREGTVEFPGTPGVDPNLDITASYTVRTQDSGALDVLAVLSGTLQNPRIRLTSEGDLPISESDLASYLFFGAPTYELNVASNLRGDDEGGLAESTFSTFGFGYVASTLQTLAQSLGVVDYVGLTAAETGRGAEANGIGGLLAATQIELGRYIGPELFVAYTQRLNAPTYNPGVRLEWRLDPQYTTEFFWEDRFARVPSFGLEAAQQKKVVGFFLFREWGY
jgi:TamB, inner membrane protein subunit of TAM complex